MSTTASTILPKGLGKAFHPLVRTTLCWSVTLALSHSPCALRSSDCRGGGGFPLYAPECAEEEIFEVVRCSHVGRESFVLSLGK